MFTSDLELSKELIAEAIQYNDNQKGRYDKLDRYYKGEHDIKTDPTWGKNRRIVVNHAKYITDTNVGYLLGNNVEYQVREEANPEIIEPILEEYREQHIGRTDNEL
jgi:SPP1 family phage portal protein